MTMAMMGDDGMGRDVFGIGIGCLVPWFPWFSGVAGRKVSDFFFFWDGGTVGGKGG